MAGLNLTILSVDELLDIRDYVDALLRKRMGREKRELERTLARITGSGSGGGRRPGRPSPLKGLPSPLKGRKIAPQYRNPETGETWAGRGMRPRWLRGRNLQEFAIDPIEPRKKRTVLARRKPKGR